MCSRGFKRLFRVDLGLTDYARVWELQKRLVELRRQSRVPDMLLITQHEPVITMGRATNRGNLLASDERLRQKGVSLFEIERGGDITFHGPGQSVLYPIIDLTCRGKDLHKYLRDLENWLIESLKELGLSAGTKKGLTGVWVNDSKVAAIGVAVSRWVTYHGVALNVNTDLDYFRLINPCGITQYPVGSLKKLLDRQIDIDEVNNILADNFASLFYYEMESIRDINALLMEKVQI